MYLKFVNGSIIARPYWSLDHLHALMPQFIDGPCNVHFVFHLELFKNDINTYECTSSPHSSTACTYIKVNTISPLHVRMWYENVPCSYIQQVNAKNFFEIKM